MVPNFVTFLDSFPATANGKLDRAALLGGTDTALAARAERIAALFAQVLGVDRIDPDGDLWDQGATSFTVVQVADRLAADGGGRIGVSAMLAEPTATGIAKAFAAEPATDVDFFSARQRAEFKAGRPHLRPADPAAPRIALTPAPPSPRSTTTGGPAIGSSLPNRCRSVRSASCSTCSARPLWTVETAGSPIPRRVRATRCRCTWRSPRDGSPGSPTVANNTTTTPESHTLHQVGAASGPDRSTHFYYNRPIADAAALHAASGRPGECPVQPVYGAATDRYTCPRRPGPSPNS